MISASNGCFPAGWNSEGEILMIHQEDMRGFIVDNDLNIYTTKLNSLTIQKWTPNTNNPTDLFKEQFPINAMFYHILSGALYIFNVTEGKPSVYKLLTIDKNTIPIRVINSNGLGSDLNQFGRSSHGLYITSLGDIFVLDDDNDRVVKWVVNATAGILVAQSGMLWYVHADRWTMSSLCVDEINNILYIVDINNNHIIKYTNESTVGQIIFGSGPKTVFTNIMSEYVPPISIIVDKMGNILVGEFYKITRWTQDLKLNVIITLEDSVTSNWHSRTTNYPTIMAFDKFDNLYVYDASRYRILKFLRNDTSCLNNLR